VANLTKSDLDLLRDMRAFARQNIRLTSEPCAHTFFARPSDVMAFCDRVERLLKPETIRLPNGPVGKDSLERVYKCIRDYTDLNGYSPTLREICEITGIRSTSQVHYLIGCLAEQKRLCVTSSRARAIRLLEEQP
jgi:hypothetical protein